jgi:hypothetical protein
MYEKSIEKAQTIRASGRSRGKDPEEKFQVEHGRAGRFAH